MRPEEKLAAGMHEVNQVVNHKLDGKPKRASRLPAFLWGILFGMLTLLVLNTYADLRDKGSICVRSLCLVLDHGKG